MKTIAYQSSAKNKSQIRIIFSLISERVGWMVCILSNKEKNQFLLEGGHPSFYGENVPFSSTTIFSSSPTPKLVSCHQDSKCFLTPVRSGRTYIIMPHLGQSHNVVIRVLTFPILSIYRACGVMVMDRADCISHSTNTLGKGMNPIILPSASLGEGKLWIQTC